MIPVKDTDMLDTNICSFIMREQPEAVIKRLEQAVLRNHRIVVSAITYAKMRFSAIGKKVSPRNWLTHSAPAWMPSRPGDATTEVKAALSGPNDTAIAGHAIAADAILVTNNTREFARVPDLKLEDWVK
ncbi:PIN domain-containing protein [Serratia silvae]|uniref:PIN domain-containing protein n=1 Tax=Serratia silvae TaxID=2824122 RepID=A0ABT0KBA9_9GAMM|nr:PIN domain-containing protein [Serratia silvae]MCL1028813.1 PIN domain-containing protein [Serratia silvae]